MAYLLNTMVDFLVYHGNSRPFRVKLGLQEACPKAKYFIVWRPALKQVKWDFIKADSTLMIGNTKPLLSCRYNILTYYPILLLLSYYTTYTLNLPSSLPHPSSLSICSVFSFNFPPSFIHSWTSSIDRQDIPWTNDEGVKSTETEHLNSTLQIGLNYPPFGVSQLEYLSISQEFWMSMNH